MCIRDRYYASPIIQSQAGAFTTSEVSETVAWDTRDARLNTTKGWLLRNSWAIAGAPGTQNYIRTTVDAVIYQKIVEDVIVSIGGSAGATQNYSGNQLRLTELFFVGGDNLRGFAAGGIGPRDLNTGDSLGGEYFYTGTAEASFPLGVPKEIGITGKAFVDIGSLWGAQTNYSYNVNLADNASMRVGAGFGIQWVSPFGPIRVDYAWPLQQQYYDKTQNLRFGFGTRF